MKKQIEFVVENTPQEAIELIKRYFLNEGFQLNLENNENLVFSRGSILRNMVTFNPLKWKSEIDIYIKHGAKLNIQSIFNINTSGQAVTKKEEELWNSFIENFKSSIITGSDCTALNNHKLLETKNHAWIYIKWALIGAVVTGIPSGIIAYWTGYDILVPIGAASGALAIMMNKINQDRKTTGLK